jgi:hypothetical protein
VFVRQGSARLDFHDQPVVDQQVRKVFAEDGAVLVIHVQGMLLPDRKTVFSQPMSQTILIDFLQMPVAMESMEGEARFTNHVAETEDIEGGVHPLIVTKSRSQQAQDYHLNSGAGSRSMLGESREKTPAAQKIPPDRSRVLRLLRLFAANYCPKQRRTASTTR